MPVPASFSDFLELVDAREAFLVEMNKWKDKNLNIPFVFTEFGTDTLAAEHKLPSIMWSQEYQNEYLDMNFEVFDQFDLYRESWFGILLISRQQRESCV